MNADCEMVTELAGNYIAEELTEGGRSFVDLHLAGCSSCSKFYAGQRELVARLHTVQATALPGAWFTERLLDRLMRDNESTLSYPDIVDPYQLSFTNL